MITLQFADVPLDADVANPRGRPLGTREQVAARMVDLLPGTSFDGNGRGAFRRGAYEIAFMLYGEPTTAVGVAFDQAEAFAPLARIVEKTGWCLIDPGANGLVDVAASRSAGRTVLVGDGSALPDDAPGARDAPAAGGRTRAIRAAAIGLVIVAAAYGVVRGMAGARVTVGPESILATQSQVTRFEKYPDRLVRRKTYMPTLPAPYSGDRIVEQLVDVRMASRAYFHFVDGRFTSPSLLSNERVWSRFQMPAFLPAAFGERQRDGYDFEFVGRDCEESEPGWPECRTFVYFARPLGAPEGGATFALFSADDKIHVRTDGKTPGAEDPTID